MLKDAKKECWRNMHEICVQALKCKMYAISLLHLNALCTFKKGKRTENHFVKNLSIKSKLFIVKSSRGWVYIFLFYLFWNVVGYVNMTTFKNVLTLSKYVFIHIHT